MRVSDPIELRPGARVWHGFLDRAAQDALVADIRDVVSAAPLFRPVTARGRPMSVRMTSAGTTAGCRTGSATGTRRGTRTAWCGRDPAARAGHLGGGVGDGPSATVLPGEFLRRGCEDGPASGSGRGRFHMPVVSMSLGDDALFRVGGIARGGKTQSVWLKSGDVAVCRVRRGWPITVSIASARAVRRFCPGAGGST
jgi:alkylated DNA repair protein (DNA oxidative demethylase)